MQKRLKFLLVLLFSQLAFVGMSHAQYDAPDTDKINADSAFMVHNTLGEKIRVQVFLAGDLICGDAEFSRTIPAGTTKEIKCENVKAAYNRCKIRVRRSKNGNVICKGLRNTCRKSAIKMRNGSEITISNDPSAKSNIACEHTN